MSALDSPYPNRDSGAAASSVVVRVSNSTAGEYSFNTVRPTWSAAGKYHVSRQSRFFTGALQFCSDFAALCISAAVAGALAWLTSTYILHSNLYAADSTELTHRFVVWSCLFTALCCWFALNGAYTVRRPLRDEMQSIVTALFVMLLTDGFIEFVSKEQFSRLWVVLIWLLAGIVLPIARVSIRRTLDFFGLWRIGAAVIGSGSHASSVTRSMEDDNYLGYSIVYHAGIETGSEGPVRLHATKLSTNMALRGAQVAILIPSEAEISKMDGVINALNLCLIPYIFVPPFQRLPTAGLTIQAMVGLDAVILAYRSGLMSPAHRALKRGFDIVATGALLIAILPLFVLISACVAASGGPIFFGHERVGQDGRRFRCLKFRSMAINSADILKDLFARDPKAAMEWQQNFKLSNDPRVTPLGRFLRQSSLDELPQLLNVLRGDMSLVGPRPVIEKELKAFYGEDALYYCLVRPGITGLWQVSGRSKTSYERRVYLDTVYVLNWSLWQDLVILFKTAKVVLSRDGAI